MSFPDTTKEFTNDVCRKKLLNRIFDGHIPHVAMDVDMICCHPDLGFLVFEFLKCGESQTITPWEASPMNYWNSSYSGAGGGNSWKFLSLYEIAKALGGQLILIDYSDEDERPDCADKFKVTYVHQLTESGITIKQEKRLLYDEFSEWFKKIINECNWRRNPDAYYSNFYSFFPTPELGDLEINYMGQGVKICEVYERDFDYLKNYRTDEVNYHAVQAFIKRKEKNRMSQRILIIGEPGSGKSASLRNLPPEETFFIDADQKGLPWRGWREQYNVENHNYARTNDHEKVQALIDNIATKGTDIHYIVVDTLSSLMIHDEMMRAKEKNFDRWMDLATCVYNMVAMAGTYRDDLTIIFIGHSQTERDDSGYNFTRMKTSGKKLDKICLESLFNVVLLAKVQDGEYVFETQANNSTTRTPMGAFEELTVPNDIVQVLDVLKEF